MMKILLYILAGLSVAAIIYLFFLPAKNQFQLDAQRALNTTPTPTPDDGTNTPTTKFALPSPNAGTPTTPSQNTGGSTTPPFDVNMGQIPQTLQDANTVMLEGGNSAQMAAAQQIINSNNASSDGALDLLDSQY